jgi:hypothetical protein
MTNWNEMMLRIIIEKDEKKAEKLTEEYVEKAVEVLKF